MSYAEKYRSVNEFLDRVCRQVRAKDMHAEIREELLSHIEERTERLKLEGNAEEPAVLEAVKQMGAPEEIGRSLHMAHRPQLDWKLLVLLGLLSLIGLLGMLNVDYSGTPAVTDLFAYKAGYFAIGMLMLALFYFFDYRKLRKYSGVLFFLTLCSMALTLVRGTTINGQMLYLDVGSIMIPSLGTLSVVLLLIAMAGMKPASEWGLWESVFQLLYRGVLPMVLYGVSNSKVYLIVYMLGFAAMLWVTAKSAKQFMLLLTLPLIGLACVLWTKMPYLMWRLEGLSDQEGGGGYFMRVTAEAVTSAGWFGQGFGAANPGIPYVQSDAIFPYLVYCFGWVFGIVLAGLVLLFLFRIWRISGVLRDAYAKNIATGIIVVLGIRFVLPLLMGLGIAPAVSLDLPFIAYGGTNQVLDMAVIGLILSVYRRKNMIPSEVGNIGTARVY